MTFKKHLFIVLCSTLVIFWAGGPAEATNRLGWSEQQAALWKKMADENHPYWTNLVRQADGKNYDDRGMRDGIVYLVTGNKEYAHSAWRHVRYWCGRNYTGNQSEDNPNWCKEDWKGYPTRNGTRDQFLRLAMLYSWVADALPPEDKANFRDILDYWADLCLNQGGRAHGTRPDDSDELIGHYFGLVIYALAIQDEDPKRSQEILNYPGSPAWNDPPVGGVDATEANFRSMRNTVALFAKKAKGGQWIESNEYNLTTVRYLLIGVAAINDFYKEDKFPEVTALIPAFAKTFVQELTPDFRDSFQWGDIQDPHNLSYFNRIPLMSTVAGLSKDPQALYVFDYLLNHYKEPSGSYRGVADAWHFHADPYSPREAPRGVSWHNAQGPGFAYWHSGWNPKDSFFASRMTPPLFVDHDGESMTNFNLYRNGHWVITNPKGYYGYKIEAPYMNGLMINGGVSKLNEACGQTAFQAGPTYMYHLGSCAGVYDDPRKYNPAPEFVHEWNRSIVYLHHPDDAVSIIIFDRVNSSDPTDQRTMTIGKFQRLPETVQKRIKATKGRHQWIIHMEDPEPFRDKNVFTWKALGGQEIVLVTFMDDYEVKFYDEHKAFNKGYPLYLTGYMKPKELKYQLRLIPKQKDGFLTLLNFIHVGSSFHSLEITAKEGEKATGVFLKTPVDDNVVIFNGTEKKPPKPSPYKGPLIDHDHTRLEKTKQLRYFEKGFTIVLPKFKKGSIYLMDLDPEKEWSAVLANGRTVPLDVSDQGVAILPRSHETETDITLKVRAQ